MQRVSWCLLIVSCCGSACAEPAADYNSDLYNNDYGFGYQSWVLVDLLKIGDAKHKTTHFNDYVSSVMIGENPVTAAEHSFGDLKKLQVVVDAYAAQFAYESYPVTLSASALPDEASFQLPPVSQADVDAQRSRVLIGVGRPEDAERLLRAVLKQDPTNAQAHETMGLLKERKGDFNAAKDWYSKALRLNPKDAQVAAGLARACMKTKDARAFPQ